MLNVRDTDKHIGIVLAKGDSRRLPKKNMRMAGGRPLFAHGLQSLRDSGVCRNVVVATTTNELADMALENGADDVIMRDPDWDSRDYLWDHALKCSIQKYEEDTGERYDYCSVIQGNALFVLPSWFRTATHVMQNFIRHKRSIQNIVFFRHGLIPFSVSRIDRLIVQASDPFEMPFKGIFCDIDNAQDLKLASTIADLIVSGEIPYPANECVHDELFIERNPGHYIGLEPINHGTS